MFKVDDRFQPQGTLSPLLTPLIESLATSNPSSIEYNARFDNDGLEVVPFVTSQLSDSTGSQVFWTYLINYQIYLKVRNNNNVTDYTCNQLIS